MGGFIVRKSWPSIGAKVFLLRVRTRRHLQIAETCSKNGDLIRALSSAIKAAKFAELLDDIEMMIIAGEHLERLNEFEISGRILAKVGRALTKTTELEWDGGRLFAGTLVVEQRIREIGWPIRMARLFPLAAQQAEYCKVIIHPRLLSLFARSFPEVEFLESGVGDAAVKRSADAVASIETLMQHLTPTPAAVAASFRTLCADARQVLSFRHSYFEGDVNRPVLGISWSSANASKEVPELELWAKLLQGSDAHVVSLQYGETKNDRSFFNACGIDVMHDPTVDAMGDLDRFAAQVASVDVLVTISNSTAHLAGALGVPTIVILDDKLQLTWPVNANSTPWYPSMHLIRRSGRSWAEVLTEVAAQLAVLFKEQSTKMALMNRLS